MQLVADRFAVNDDGRAFDLATGTRVTLRLGSAGGVSDQMRWTEQCTARRALYHRAIARLVDFGLTGECSRFEAWSTGYPEEEARTRGALRIVDCGLRMVERPAVLALAEMFDAAHGSRPRVSALFGPAGSGKSAIAGELARIARLKGFVPVAARLILSRQAELWQGRSLFVIADEADERTWTAFLNAAMTDSQPHVLLRVGEDELRSVGGVSVGRVPVDALVSAVQPSVLGGRLEPIVRKAAERAHGLPGRFARLLWPDSATARPSLRRSRLPRVAEQVAVYGGDEAIEEVFDAPPATCAWPAPGELAALRRRMDQAVADIARGRHAPGIRALRQVVGSLARRGAWIDAASGALALARALLGRGRTRGALTAAAEGRDYATRADQEPALVDLAIVTGEAWIDLGRLDEADSVLGTALAAARASGDSDRVSAAALALARAAYWRGACADAEALLATAPDAPALHVRRALLSARVAVGQGDPARAMSLLTAASALPVADHDLATRAAIASVTGFVHLAVGDLDAAERDVSAALALARRDPQRAIRVRLLQAEVERARRGPAAALGRLQRLRRAITTAPAIVRARWDLAQALSSPHADPRAIVEKYLRSSGLGALAWYVARAPAAGRVHPSGDPFADEIVAIVRVCQTASDEGELLTSVCVRLRQHLHAATVAFVALRDGQAHVVCSDGARIDTDVGARAVAARITIAPHSHHDRIEAAAPIEYGGAPVGALCARWALGSTYDISRAGAVLAMSAAAAAPMLAALTTRQSHERSGPGDLLGMTPPIVELRRSVERAAAAPFAVLVDGESGSGKELVARAIHLGSTRRHKSFCTLNCAALPDDLIEAELFGHSRGAFTGAIADRAGLFEEAHGGTLFLDEVGELTPRAQAKLLRVMQDGELRRVGESVSRRVDVRIVSATNRALKHEVEAGRFRLDLLYRLDVVHIAVPPLRARREDIAVLAEHFWRDASARVGGHATLGAATLAALARYDWPGNVRELQNVLASLAVRTPKRGVVPASALPPPFAERGPAEETTLEEARRTFEHRFVRAALVRTGGHRGRAAAELGLTRQGLTKLMSRLAIQ